MPTPSRLRLLALAAAAGLVAACFAVFGWSLEAVVNAAACLVLVAVSVTDLEERRIPNRVVVPATVAALAVQTARDPSVEWVASLAAGGFFLVAALVYPPGLGMGDVKLAAFLGAWLGRHVVIACFAGSLLALVPSLVILVRVGAKRGRKVGIPYGPFLALGGVVALFWGEELLDAWLG